jgi:NTE family protein
MRSFRRARVVSFAAGATFTCLTATTAHTQPGPSQPNRTEALTPRIAIVLSGGGAKGLAHIGVLRALEAEGISPDIVTGTSMGALLGGLYATGYSAAALDTLTRQLDWNAVFSDAVSFRYRSLERRLNGERTLITLPMRRWRPLLPTGAVTGQAIAQLLSRLTWRAQLTRNFRSLPREFAAVATDIETGQPVVLTNGSLPDAMRASMALPSVFEPVRLAGRLLVDGGIVRNLPASDARDLGATFVICSNVSSPLARAERIQSITDVLRQTIAFNNIRSAAEQRGQCDIEILPDVASVGIVGFSNISDIIARGAAAAAAAHEQLAALRATLASAVPSHAAALPSHDSTHVHRIVLRGVAGRAEQQAREALELRDDSFVSARGLDVALQRAYATELYDRITYEINADSADTTLVVTAAPRTLDRGGFGFRFDDTFKAALLFTALTRNWFGDGSTTALELRLGTQLKLSAEVQQASARHPRLSYGASASVLKVPLTLVNDSISLRVAEISLSVGQLRSFATAKFGGRGGIRAEALVEGSFAKTAISQADTSARDLFAALGVTLAWDGLDRPAYPLHGVSVVSRSTLAGGTTNFFQQSASLRWAQPLVRSLTLVTDMAIGVSTNPDAIPPHRLFQLGGAYPGALLDGRQIPMPGLRPAQEVGSAVLRSGVTLQWEARRNLFASLRSYGGYAGRSLTFDETLYRGSGAISLGTLTPAGLVEITLANEDLRGRTRVELNIGHMF